MSDLLGALEEHFDDEDARVVATVLRTAVRYKEGDAFASAKLRSLGPGGYRRLTEMFEEAGIDASFEGRLGLLAFVGDPDTGDERLDEAIRDL